MALKDILIHLDNSPSSLNRLDLAIDLAHTHGAHLKGIYVLPHYYEAPRHGLGVTEAALQAELMFCERAAQAGITAEWILADWAVTGLSATEFINLHAFFSDLVIIGQPDNNSPDQSTPFDLPERLGLGAGRPLLIVPYAGNFSSISSRVMIAWKAGRESVRAINDAMPILEKAGNVSVMTISSSETSTNRDAEYAPGICSHLGRHSINATHEHILSSSGISIGDVLLNHACEHRISLLVMGAFAQSRRGAYMLGPVARHLLNFMTVPILISH